MHVTTLVAPAGEPLGLAEVKEYLRIAYDGENSLVTALVAGARARIEELAGVAMISRTLRVTLDRWPARTVETRVLRLPVRPAGTLVAVRVFDHGGAAEVVTDRFALTAGRAARLVWTNGAFPWPGRRHDGIEIDYTAGFGEAPEDVAEGLRLAVKRLAAHGYHARDPGSMSGRLPEDVAGTDLPVAPGVAVSAEEALEAAILVALAEDAEVTQLLGGPLRVIGAGGPAPAFPYLEVVRHESADAGAAGVEASEHRIDLAVVCRDSGGARVKAAIAAVRAVLSGAELAMTGWRCVFLVPLFSDAARSGIQMWRGLLRLKAVVERA